MVGVKGKKAHILGGAAIFVVSATLVALVAAVIATENVAWGRALIIHAILGSKYVWSLFAAISSGLFLLAGKTGKTKYHRWAAYSMGIFLALAITSSFFIG
jgi:hypothetical protein